MPEDSKPPNSIVAQATRQAETALAGADPEPFSPKAFEALKRAISWFIAELVDQSVKVSKRHRSDNVAESHVQTAVQFLVGDAPGRIFRHLGTIGGVLLGAALSNLLSMITTKVFSVPSVGITVALAVIGAFLVALHIARD
jgi:hypothetical protein